MYSAACLIKAQVSESCTGGVSATAVVPREYLKSVVLTFFCDLESAKLEISSASQRQIVWFPIPLFSWVQGASS